VACGRPVTCANPANFDAEIKTGGDKPKSPHSITAAPRDRLQLPFPFNCGQQNRVSPPPCPAYGHVLPSEATSSATTNSVSFPTATPPHGVSDASTSYLRHAPDTALLLFFYCRSAAVTPFAYIPFRLSRIALASVFALYISRVSFGTYVRLPVFLERKKGASISHCFHLLPLSHPFEHFLTLLVYFLLFGCASKRSTVVRTCYLLPFILLHAYIHPVLYVHITT
jgi:hypothetical protein